MWPSSEEQKPLSPAALLSPSGTVVTLPRRQRTHRARKIIPQLSSSTSESYGAAAASYASAAAAAAPASPAALPSPSSSSSSAPSKQAAVNPFMQELQKRLSKKNADQLAGSREQQQRQEREGRRQAMTDPASPSSSSALDALSKSHAAQVARSNANIQRLEQALADFKADAEMQLAKEVGQYTRQMEQLRHQLRQLQQALSQQQQQHQLEVFELQQHQADRVEHLRSMMAKLQDNQQTQQSITLAAHQVAMDELRWEVEEERRAARRQLEKERKKMEEERAAMRKETAAVSAHRSASPSSSSLTTSDPASSSSQQASLNSHPLVSTLQRQADDLSSQLNQSSQREQELRTQLEQLRSDHSKWQEQLGELEQLREDNSHLTDQIKELNQLRKEKSKLTDQLKEMEQLRADQAKSQQQLKQFDQLRKDKARLQKQLQEFDQFRAEHSELQRQLQELDQLRTDKSKLQEQLQELDQLRSDQSQLQEQLTHSEARCAELHSSLQQLEASHKELQSSHQVVVEDYQTEIRKLVEEIVPLEHKLAGIMAENERLKAGGVANAEPVAVANVGDTAAASSTHTVAQLQAANAQLQSKVQKLQYQLSCLLSEQEKPAFDLDDGAESGSGSGSGHGSAGDSPSKQHPGPIPKEQLFDMDAAHKPPFLATSASNTPKSSRRTLGTAEEKGRGMAAGTTPSPSPSPSSFFDDSSTARLEQQVHSLTHQLRDTESKLHASDAVVQELEQHLHAFTARAEAAQQQVESLVISLESRTTKLETAKTLVLALNQQRKELLTYKLRKKEECEKLKEECKKWYDKYQEASRGPTSSTSFFHTQAPLDNNVTLDLSSPISSRHKQQQQELQEQQSQMFSPTMVRSPPAASSFFTSPAPEMRRLSLLSSPSAPFPSTGPSSSLSLVPSSSGYALRLSTELVVVRSLELDPSFFVHWEEPEEEEEKDEAESRHFKEKREEKHQQDDKQLLTVKIAQYIEREVQGLLQDYSAWQTQLGVALEGTPLSNAAVSPPRSSSPKSHVASTRSATQADNPKR